MIREILKVTQQPDVISFAGGLPAPELFPAADIGAATVAVMGDIGPAALQYSLTEGVPELRRWVADRLNAAHGMTLDVEDIIITGGSQQALDLFAKVFIDPGDTIVVENPTYLGALQAFNAYEAEYLPVAIDAGGIVPEALEELLATARPFPKFLYLTPNYQNPTGVRMPAERRRAVLAICARYALPVFEDDPYGDLCFDGLHERALVAHESEASVTYSGTGSKLVAPGLRVAWMVVPDALIREKIVHAKQAADLHTGSFAQYVFHRYVTTGDLLTRHVERVRTTYAARRDVMAAAIRDYLPAHVQFALPLGGMFLWATVDPSVDTDELFTRAARASVVFVPGRPFHPGAERSDGMRLNFSNADGDTIRTGIKRLAAAMRE